MQYVLGTKAFLPRLDFLLHLGTLSTESLKIAWKSVQGY